MTIEEAIRTQKIQESIKPVCGRNEEHVTLLGRCVCPFNCTWCYWYVRPIREENK